MCAHPERTKVSLDDKAVITATALRDVQYAESSNLPDQDAEWECEFIVSDLLYRCVKLLCRNAKLDDNFNAHANQHEHERILPMNLSLSTNLPQSFLTFDFFSECRVFPTCIFFLI